jgi:hypothetical protein
VKNWTGRITSGAMSAGSFSFGSDVSRVISIAARRAAARAAPKTTRDGLLRGAYHGHAALLLPADGHNLLRGELARPHRSHLSPRLGTAASLFTRCLRGSGSGDKTRDARSNIGTGTATGGGSVRGENRHSQGRPSTLEYVAFAAAIEKRRSAAPITPSGP